jgi:four helix bundle protein
VKAQRHSELVAWQKAMDLVEGVYKITKCFPKEETYGLVSQLRRAVVSVPSNIAEGHSRSGSREFVHRLSIAHGSLSEVETQVEIAKRLGYITGKQQEDIGAVASETGRLIVGLMKSLERRIATEA